MSIKTKIISVMKVPWKTGNNWFLSIFKDDYEFLRKNKGKYNKILSDI